MRSREQRTQFRTHALHVAVPGSISGVSNKTFSGSGSGKGCSSSAAKEPLLVRVDSTGLDGPVGYLGLR